MKLEQSFDMAAPVERVWATLIDVEAVASCLPGAEITGADDVGTYRGTFSIKLGPASAAYAGSVNLETIDEATRTVVMRAKGQDKRGQGSAEATIECRVSGNGGVSRVNVVSDVTITGRLARFGRGGMMQDVAGRLLRDLAAASRRASAAATRGCPPGRADRAVSRSQRRFGGQGSRGRARPGRRQRGGRPDWRVARGERNPHPATEPPNARSDAV